MFVTLTCAFRYGREDLDVLGLTFRKDLFVANSQVFPPAAQPETRLTHLQERLMKKLGEHAHPFTFQVPSPRRPGDCCTCAGSVGPLEPSEQVEGDCRGSVWLLLRVFQIPLNLPCSVTLQPGPEDTGKVSARLSSPGESNPWHQRSETGPAV